MGRRLARAMYQPIALRLHALIIYCPKPQFPTQTDLPIFSALYAAPAAVFKTSWPTAHALAHNHTCLNVLCAAPDAAQACVLVQQALHLQGGQLADLVPVGPPQQVRGLLGGMSMLVAVGLHLVQNVAQERALHRGEPAQAEQLQQAGTASGMFRGSCSSKK